MDKSTEDVIFTAVVASNFNCHSCFHLVMNIGYSVALFRCCFSYSDIDN